MSQSQQPLVRNAADPKQVKRAELQERLRSRDEINDLLTVASTKQGRRFLWKMLEKCKTFGSVYESSSRIYYNAGRQELGQDLLRQIFEADPLLFNKMREENI